MKDNNLPDNNSLQTLEELTSEANHIIEELEKENDLKNSLNNYQKLIRLNNIIEKKFQKKSKQINETTKEKIKTIVNIKNAKKT